MTERSLPNSPVEITPPNSPESVSLALSPPARPPRSTKTREKLADLSRSASSARIAGSESGEGGTVSAGHGP